jgi:hypothetical protein
MNYRRLLFSATCLLTILVLTIVAFTSTAAAQSVTVPGEVELGEGDQSNANKTRIDLSVGLKGGVAMSAASEVPDLTPQQQGQYRTFDDSGIFGAFGVGAGVGLSLEARIIELIGLETGFYYTQDDATGWLDKNDANSNANFGRIFSDQETSALHIPLLFKINASTDTVKPFLGLGFEFVLQQDSSISYRTDDPPVQPFVDAYGARNTITPSNYTLFQLTTGIEIDLGDIRVPIEIRGGYNLGFDDRFSERFDPEERPDGSNEFVYNGEYQGHFGFFVGVMYDYELYL